MSIILAQKTNYFKIVRLTPDATVSDAAEEIFNVRIVVLAFTDTLPLDMITFVFELAITPHVRYDILLIFESHAIVPCFFQICVAQITPEIKPIEIIIIATIFPVSLLHFTYVTNEISAATNVTPITICSQPIISRIISISFMSRKFCQTKNNMCAVVLKSKGL